MNKIDNSEVAVEEEKKKNKLITTYRIPMVGGSSYYGVAHPEGGTVSPSDSGGGGE